MDSHIAIDIETMGTEINSVILSIGAVGFDTIGIHQLFHVSIEMDSCIEYGMELSTDTLIWWLVQDKKAKDSLVDKMKTAIPISDALEDFKKFYMNFDGTKEFKKRKTCIWGNGSDFDNAMLSYACYKTGVEYPAPYWCNRDMRTILALCEGKVKRVEPKIKHSAISDAEAQATTIIECMQYLGGQGTLF